MAHYIVNGLMDLEGPAHHSQMLNALLSQHMPVVCCAALGAPVAATSAGATAIALGAPPSVAAAGEATLRHSAWLPVCFASGHGVQMTLLSGELPRVLL